MTRVIQADEWHASLVGQSLNLMRESGVLCDIIIQSCEGREFLAHGCILAAASPILKAAINNTIGQLSTLRMEWLSGSVLETLLNFIYTGELKVYSGDTTMVSDFLYAVGQLEMTGVLVTCKNEDSAGTCPSATAVTGERNIKSSVTKHTGHPTARHTEHVSANKVEVSSTNKGEVSSVNKDKVSSADKAIVSSVNKTEVTFAKKASVNKANSATTNKTNVSSASKDVVSSTNRVEGASASKLLPESSKSEESGADHSYADAISTDQQCAEPSRCVMSARPWPAKYSKKTRLWGCPTPMMVNRKNYLTRPYSLKCPICLRCFGNSLALANHRLADAPLRVFRVWQGKLEELNDNVVLGKATDTTEDKPTTSAVESATDTANPEITFKAKPVTKGMFACPQCGKEFKKKIELKNHSKVHVPPLTCPVCSRTCKSRSKLRRHQLSHTREKPYVCKVCDKSFQLNESLVIHGRLHTGERPFKCCICNQGFRDKSVLRNHELKHTGAKPFQCAQCGRQYGSRNALSRHRNVHTLERCYQCEHCTRVFYQLSGLMCHRRTHTGEKPYVCSICARAFGDRSSMRRHERVHTGERPYACPTCNKTFTQSSSLKSHQKTHVKRGVPKIICVEVHPPQAIPQLPQGPCQQVL